MQFILSYFEDVCTFVLKTQPLKPLKIKKTTTGFAMFSGGIEMNHRDEMG